MRRWLPFIAMAISLTVVLGDFLGGDLWLRAGAAVVILLAGLLIGQRTEKDLPELETKKSLQLIDLLVGGFVLLCIVSVATFSLIGVKKVVVFESIGVSGAETSEEGVSVEGDNWLLGDTISRELPNTSDHQPKDRSEVMIRFQNANDVQQLRESGIYVRGFSFGAFDGQRWKSLSQYKRVLSDNQNLGRVLENEALPVYAYDVLMLSKKAGRNIVMSLQNALSIDYPRLTQISDGVVLLSPSDDNMYQYQAQSQPLLLDQVVQFDESLEEGELSEAYYSVNLPTATVSQINDLLEDVDVNESVTVKLEFIKSLLNQRCEYSLKVENPNGLDSMENFLFDERVGYCEHFATAAALLCRKLSIPSRVAYGYAGGTVYPKSDLIVFKAKNAHAWAEVYLKGYGWVVFETTPMNDSIEVQTVSGDEEPPDLTAEPTENEEVLDSEKVSFPWWVIITATAGAGVIALLLYFKNSQTLNYVAALRRGSDVTLPSYYSEFEKACTELGIVSVQSKSVDKLIEDLSQMGVEEAFLSDLATYHKQVFYQFGEQDSKKEEQLLKAIQHWKANN